MLPDRKRSELKIEVIRHGPPDEMLGRSLESPRPVINSHSSHEPNFLMSLIDLLRHENPDTAHHAVSALFDLTSESARLPELVNTDKLIQNLNSLLGSDEAETRQYAAGALANLSNDPTLLATLVGTEGLIENLTRLTGSGDVQTKQYTAGVLSNLMSLPGSIEKLGSPTVLTENLTDLLRSDDLKTSLPAVKILHNLSGETRLRKDLVRTEGLVQNLNTLLSSGDPETKRLVAETLSNLSFEIAQLDDIDSTKGLVEKLNRLLLSDDRLTKLYAARAFANILQKPNLVTGDIPLELIQNLKNLWGSSNKMTEGYATIALGCLFANPSLSPNIVDIPPGLFQNLSSLLRSDIGSIKPAVVKILHNLSGETRLRKDLVRTKGLGQNLYTLLSSGDPATKRLVAKTLSNLSIEIAQLHDIDRTKGLVENLNRLLLSDDRLTKLYAAGALANLSNEPKLLATLLGTEGLIQTFNTFLLSTDSLTREQASRFLVGVKKGPGIIDQIKAAAVVLESASSAPAGLSDISVLLGSFVDRLETGQRDLSSERVKTLLPGMLRHSAGTDIVFPPDFPAPCVDMIRHSDGQNEPAKIMQALRYFQNALPGENSVISGGMNSLELYLQTNGSAAAYSTLVTQLKSYIGHLLTCPTEQISEKLTVFPGSVDWNCVDGTVTRLNAAYGTMVEQDLYEESLRLIPQLPSSAHMETFRK